MKSNYIQKTINSNDPKVIAYTVVSDFIKKFAKDTLNIECLDLKVKKDEYFKSINRSKTNKENWNNKGYYKGYFTIPEGSMYNFSFNIVEAKYNNKNKSAILLNLKETVIKDVKGDVYIRNGNIVRIVINIKDTIENIIMMSSFNESAYKIIRNYFSLVDACSNRPARSNKSNIEYSCIVRANNLLLESVSIMSMESISKLSGHKIQHPFTIMFGIPRSSELISDLESENFLVIFKKNKVESIESKKLNEMHKKFEDLPNFKEIVTYEDVDSYVKIIEMSTI